MERANQALCHLLCLSEYNRDDVSNIHDNTEMFNEVMAMLASVKARLIKHTQLTCSAAEQVGGRVVNNIELPTK